MNKLHQNMDYKVYVTDFATEQLDSYVGYIANCLRNKQAAKAVLLMLYIIVCRIIRI